MANPFNHLLRKSLAPPRYLNPSYTSFSAEQGQRDFKITENLQEMNFRGMTVNAISGNIRGNVNTLVTSNVQHKRDEYFRQLVMPWNNDFMIEPLQPQRLNNPAQASFNSQPQMSVPNVYQQFYAFMKALSAAFGTLQ